MFCSYPPGASSVHYYPLRSYLLQDHLLHQRQSLTRLYSFVFPEEVLTFLHTTKKIHALQGVCAFPAPRAIMRDPSPAREWILYPLYTCTPHGDPYVICVPRGGSLHSLDRSTGSSFPFEVLTLSLRQLFVRLTSLSHCTPQW